MPSHAVLLTVTSNLDTLAIALIMSTSKPTTFLVVASTNSIGGKVASEPKVTFLGAFGAQAENAKATMIKPMIAILLVFIHLPPKELKRTIGTLCGKSQYTLFQ